MGNAQHARADAADKLGAKQQASELFPKEELKEAGQHKKYLVSVNVCQARNLAFVNEPKPPKPYVSVHTSAGGAEQLTPTVRPSDNPVWNQHMAFEFDKKEGELVFALSGSRHLKTRVLGRAKLDLAELWDKHRTWLWLPLLDDTGEKEVGELQVEIECKRDEVALDLHDLTFTHLVRIRLVGASDLPMRQKSTLHRGLSAGLRGASSAFGFLKKGIGAVGHGLGRVRRKGSGDSAAAAEVDADPPTPSIASPEEPITPAAEQAVPVATLASAANAPAEATVQTRLANPNTFCQVSFGPHSYRTRTIRDSVSPQWEQECYFYVSGDVARDYNALFRVVHEGRVRTHMVACAYMHASELLRRLKKDNSDSSEEKVSEPPATPADSAEAAEAIAKAAVAVEDGAERVITIPLQGPDHLASSDRDLHDVNKQHPGAEESHTFGSLSIVVQVFTRDDIITRFCKRLVDEFATEKDGFLSLLDVELLVHSIGGLTGSLAKHSIRSSLYEKCTKQCGTEELDAKGLLLFLATLSHASPVFSVRLLQYFRGNLEDSSDDGNAPDSSSAAQSQLVRGPSLLMSESADRNVTSLSTAIAQTASKIKDSVKSRLHIGTVSNAAEADGTRASAQEIDPSSASEILVKDRNTGLTVTENIPSYIKVSLKAMFRSRLGRFVTKTHAFNAFFTEMSRRQGRKYDDPKSKASIQGFIDLHEINMDEALLPAEEYPTFNEFFYRKLKDGVRPMSADPKDLVSPADCRMSVFAEMGDATRFWIKGANFTLENLLGPLGPANAHKYRAGSLCIARLAPQDYHRWHTPVSGRLGPAVALPGNLFTVNPIAVNRTVDVFTENKRTICVIHSPVFGQVILVAVGATMVGSIHITAKHQEVNLAEKAAKAKPATAAAAPGAVEAQAVPVAPPESKEIKEDINAQLDKAEQAAATENVLIARGEEHGYFAFGGSTVLLLFEPGKVKWSQDLLDNSALRIETLVKCRSTIGRLDETQK